MEIFRRRGRYQRKNMEIDIIYKKLKYNRRQFEKFREKLKKILLVHGRLVGPAHLFACPIPPDSFADRSQVEKAKIPDKGENPR